MVNCAWEKLAFKALENERTPAQNECKNRNVDFYLL